MVNFSALLFHNFTSRQVPHKIHSVQNVFVYNVHPHKIKAKLFTILDCFQIKKSTEIFKIQIKFLFYNDFLGKIISIRRIKPTFSSDRPIVRMWIFTLKNLIVCYQNTNSIIFFHVFLINISKFSRFRSQQ